MSESCVRWLIVTFPLRLSKQNFQDSRLMFWSDTLSLESYEKETPQSRVPMLDYNHRHNSISI